MLAPDIFRFLNEKKQIATKGDWNDTGSPKLWLYNLHYFDDLRSINFVSRKDWHVSMIEKWITDNPPFKGNGWEPYTISKRIVNWIFWALSGNDLSEWAMDSLRLQTAYLEKRLEWHLLGNHLIANAKALSIAGLFFEGKDAGRWLHKGLKILSRELKGQIFSDGGHFELSPMYHAQVLEDILDLINITQCFPEAPIKYEDELMSEFSETTKKMLTWLYIMSHPDGEIALFNDSAFGMAASLNDLAEYASRLGIEWRYESKSEFNGISITRLKDSGYIRVDSGMASAYLDVGKIGPDFLPGHAHADTLSYELSINGQRIIVDSGVSTYETGPVRLDERGTAAHNTVVVNGSDSSEVWSSFRVARRACPFNLKIDERKQEIACSHNGYCRLSGKPVHNRKWTFLENLLIVKDSISGEFHDAVSYIHVYPDVRISINDGSSGTGTFVLPNGEIMGWRVTGGHVKISDSEYHPEFGISLPNKRLEIRLTDREMEFEIVWP